LWCAFEKKWLKVEEQASAHRKKNQRKEESTAKKSILMHDLVSRKQLEIET
jgi:hypothetical protein